MQGCKKKVIQLIVFFFCLCLGPLFSLGQAPESELEEDTEVEADAEEEFWDSNWADKSYSQLSEEELFLGAVSELDTVFESKNEVFFKNVLKKYSLTSVYPLVEDYSKKQINRFIIENEIGFVLAALYAIIDINIDVAYADEEAIEMYYTIYESYALQKRGDEK
ncbi:MAG: hypothetical protein K5829_00735 [Treponema sp.]|nr:hypothetical protein [Treponema sp.]